MRARAPIILGALRMGARAPILSGRAPIILGAHPEPTSTHPLSNPLPPPAFNISWSPPPPPYLGQGGTTHPSTPFDLKSSVATSWPQDGFLTTSQAITMNPRSQWSLFEFGKWLNCERICIQKFSCCSGERGHFVLVAWWAGYKSRPRRISGQSAASDRHSHTPRGHNLNYTIWILYAESVS